MYMCNEYAVFTGYTQHIYIYITDIYHTYHVYISCITPAEDCMIITQLMRHGKSGAMSHV